MKTKKLSIALLSAIAAITFALAGLFAFGTQTEKVSAESSPAEITLVTAGYATNNSKTVSFKACTWEGTLPTGNYYGNVYVGSTPYKISVYIQDKSGAEGNNVVFYVKDYTDINNPVDFETDITSFTVKKGEIFSKGDNSVSLSFAKEYTITYAWGSTPTFIVSLINVTLSSGGWSEPTTNLARVLHTRTDSISNGKYYGDIYNADGTAVISGAYIDYTDGHLRFYFPDRSVLKFMVKRGTEFLKSDGTQTIVITSDYIVTINWAGSPAVTDIISVTLGSGRLSDSSGISFNKSVWDGTLGKGYYYGKLYKLDGTELGFSYCTIDPATSGLDANTRFVGIDSSVTEFVIRKTELFAKGDETYPFFFDKDYLVTCNWDGTPTVTAYDDFKMNSGAYIRLGDVNGLRFTANVSKSLVASYESAGYTVSAGMVILPYGYMADYGEFSATNIFGSAYASVEIINLSANLVGYSESEYRINGSIVSIKDANLERKFVGRAYLKLEKGEDVTYIMSSYYGSDVDNNSRTVMEIAETAYKDENVSAEDKAIIEELYISKKK